MTSGHFADVSHEMNFRQSVAHMPMKAMIYKTLSTVVDDLFAYVPRFATEAILTLRPDSFCIKMPILHRLACFRDDVAFLVFLYQVRQRNDASSFEGAKN